MTIIGTTLRNYFFQKYGKHLPYDLNEPDNDLTKQELEIARKYLNGESFKDFIGIDY